MSSQGKAPIKAKELREALAVEGILISQRTAYAIMRGTVALTIDKLAALGRARPELATWGLVAWFAARGPGTRHGRPQGPRQGGL
jgi:hypothetical protein